jgi:hypothetical protein
MEVSKGGAMRSQAGTVLAEEIQTGTAVVLNLAGRRGSLVGGGTGTLEVFLIFH